MRRGAARLGWVAVITVVAGLVALAALESCQRAPAPGARPRRAREVHRQPIGRPLAARTPAR